MKKQYYVVVNKERKGPYCLEDLKKMSLTQDTLVWAVGMSTWNKLADVEELHDLVKELPPPIPIKHSSVNIETKEPIQIEVIKEKTNNDSLKRKTNAIKKWFAQECIFVFKIICLIIATTLIILLGVFVYTLPPKVSDANQIAYNEESAKRKVLCDKLWEEMKYKTDDEIRIQLNENGLYGVRLEHEWDIFHTKTNRKLNYTADLKDKYLNLEELREWRNSLNSTMLNSIEIPFNGWVEDLNETMKLQHREAFCKYIERDIIELCLIGFIFIWVGRNIFFSIRWFVRWIARNK